MSLISLAIGVVFIFFVIKFLAPKASNMISLLFEAFLHFITRGFATGMSEGNKALKSYDDRKVEDILLDIIDDKPTKKK